MRNVFVVAVQKVLSIAYVILLIAINCKAQTTNYSPLYKFIGKILARGVMNQSKIAIIIPKATINGTLMAI